MLKNLSKAIYAILGSLLLIAGLVALFHPSIGIPINPDSTGVENDYILKLKNDLTHIFMEIGGAVITLGTLLLWGIFNFEKMEKLNYILLLYFLILGAIHWYEWSTGNRSLMSPLINSIPAALMALVILFRRKIEL